MKTEIHGRCSAEGLWRHAVVLLLLSFGCTPTGNEKSSIKRTGPSPAEIDRFILKVKDGKYDDEDFWVLTLTCFPSGIPVTAVEKALGVSGEQREVDGMTYYEFWPGQEKPDGIDTTVLVVKASGDPKRVRSVGKTTKLW